jgi:hypothetical protein
MLPSYLIRPDDHMIFSLNDDNLTYSTHDSKIQFPNNLHHKYKYDVLVGGGFFSSTESELDSHRNKQTEYYKRLHRLFQQEKGCGD